MADRAIKDVQQHIIGKKGAPLDLHRHGTVGLVARAVSPRRIGAITDRCRCRCLG
jgi:hypothetical protein